MPSNRSSPCAKPPCQSLPATRHRTRLTPPVRAMPAPPDPTGPRVGHTKRCDPRPGLTAVQSQRDPPCRYPRHPDHRHRAGRGLPPIQRRHRQLPGTTTIGSIHAQHHAASAAAPVTRLQHPAANPDSRTHGYPHADTADHPIVHHPVAGWRGNDGPGEFVRRRDQQRQIARG